MKLFLSFYRFWILLLALVISKEELSFARPDLTMIAPHSLTSTGLGAVPKLILECMGDGISSNLITRNPSDGQDSKFPYYTRASLTNPDKSSGNIAMFAGLIWDMGGSLVDMIPKDAPIKIIYSMLETTQIPSKWVEIFNRDLDAVIVPDENVKKVYVNSGVAIPIFVLPIPMELEPYLKCPPHKGELRKPFVFADMAAVKTPPIAVKAFALAFGNNPSVQLILRAGGSASFNTIDSNRLDTIKKIINFHHLQNVKLEFRTLPLDEYIKRLSKVDCYINISLGEGFSFMPREALALGVPCIIPNNTASSTICKSGFVYGVPSNTLRSTNSHFKPLFGEECGHQFETKLDDVVKAMQEVYHHYGHYLALAHQGREWVKQYDCRNPALKSKYCTLIKPKKVILGDRNVIEEEVLITNSITLYHKYMEIAAP